MAISVDPDEMARDEPYLALHCLQNFMCWSVGLQGLERGHLEARNKEMV